jgi:hypothetical protein
VSGYFDPLTLAHADRLKELKDPAKPLLIVVTEPPDPILPALARAHLLAGLAVVDHVAVHGPDAPPVDFSLEAEDLVRLEKLIAHVHSRQSVLNG